MGDVLQQLSNDLASTAEQAGASVVRIEARRRMPASGVVWSADGLIVTSSHGVEREDNIRIGLANGETVNATLVGRDQSTDIAVLRASIGDLTPARWAEASSLKVGHLVLALGRPGQTVQATLGVISAVGEAWRTGAGGQIDRYLQTDVVMYPGFSGGPLVGADGVVLGLNSSALARGVSVTIPGVTVRRVVEMLATHGRIKRGFLGVKAQPVRLPAALAEQLQQETGLMLAEVEDGSPAEQSGLVLGDTLVALDGQATRHMDDLLSLLSGDRIGKALDAKVLRGGQLHDLSVTVGDRE